MNRARWWWLLAGTLGIGVLAYGLGTQTRGGQPASTEEPLPTAAVERRTLSSQTKVDGILGYAGDDSVVNQLAGYFTWLPSEGDVVAPGGVLYRVGTLPVVLLKGTIPAWRDLSRGDTGADVEQLNGALAALGLLESPPESLSAFGAETEAAVRALQKQIGANPTGSLPLGHAVFFPSPLRVVSVLPVLGARADTNSIALKATSTLRRVTARVSASQLKRLRLGDEVSVTLNFGGPDQVAVRGRVSRLSTSAKSGGEVPLFEVEIVPGAIAGGIDQMPVLVGFTDATAENALVVPVTALLSTPQGHAVEVVGPQGHRLVPVQLGVFSDAEGLVQINGEGLEAGDLVVVPAL